jgi:hypothetical protein
MGENVQGDDLFGSGGHAWQWERRNRAAKLITSVGIDGAGRIALGSHERRCQIIGTHGSPAALLIGNGATKDLADTSLQIQIAAIEALADSGAAGAWQDDTGLSGTQLVVESFVPVGHRLYGCDGANWQAWLYYKCVLIDLTGNWT